MASKKIKEQTKALLKQYLKRKKPVALRNEILMLNQDLIGWVAKHYQVEGVVTFDDLMQEGMLAVMEYLDKSFCKDHIKYFSINLVRKVMSRLDKYQNEMMCSYSGEVQELKRARFAYKQYIRQNLDTWNIDSLEMHVGRMYEEIYEGKRYETPSYFCEKVDPDTLTAAEESTFETYTLRALTDALCRRCELIHNDQLAVEAYIFHEDEGKIKGPKRMTRDMLFEELAYQRGVSVERIGQNMRRGFRHLYEGLTVWLNRRRIGYVDDIHELADNDVETDMFRITNEREYFGEYLEEDIY